MTGSRLTVLQLTMLALSVAACSSRDAESDDVVVRDSSGIRIVENASPLVDSDKPWLLSPDPVIEIGADEQDSTQTLHLVEGALRLGDGRIAIANAATPALRWYDSTGAFLHGTGRFGQGPGEFDSGEGGVWIYAVWPLGGDSIGTWEHSRRRMQVFDPQGRFVRSVVTALPPGMPRLAYPQTSGLIAGGFLAYLLDARDAGPLGELRRDSVTFLRYAADGKFVRELARLPGYVRYTAEIERPGRPERLRTAIPQPFAPSFGIWPHRDRFFYGAAERYEIAAYDTSGALVLLIRRPGARRPVTARDIDRLVESRLSGVDPERRRAAEDRARAVPFPDSFPAYRRFRVDREGALWVQEYNTPGATSVAWSVFDQDGRWLADVTVPMEWRIVDIGRDYILTIESDELDIERVRMYTLTRGAAGLPRR